MWDTIQQRLWGNNRLVWTWFEYQDGPAVYSIIVGFWRLWWYPNSPFPVHHWGPRKRWVKYFLSLELD
jgi:hypothetical protein